jgi:hypothetical protein
MRLNCFAVQAGSNGYLPVAWPFLQWGKTTGWLGLVTPQVPLFCGGGVPKARQGVAQHKKNLITIESQPFSRVIPAKAGIQRL